MTRSSKAAGGNDRQHWRPRAQGLGRSSIAWSALLGTMLAGCGAAQGYGRLVLTDPLLGGMKAAVVAFPAGWKAQGSVSRVACSMFRGRRGGQTQLLLHAVSPDGQMQYRMLPVLGWQWANQRYSNPQLRQFMARQAPHQPPGCLPIFAPINAAQFVQLYAQHLRGVRIVGAAPVAPALQATVARNAAKARRRLAQSHMGRLLAQRGISQRITADAASLRLKTDSGRYDGLLTAEVTCDARNGGSSGNCSATTQLLLTPVGKLGEVSRLVASLPSVQWDPHWKAALHSVTRREFASIENANQRQANTRLRNAAREDQARSNASHRAFMQQQATQRREHDAFLGQMRSSTQRSMNNANAAMNARSTAASDWTDYALDQQTVRGANGTYKTSSQYTNVWSSPNAASPSHRRTFGSTDHNANPNSATDNTWTKDKKVHGNGHPPW